MTERSYYWDGTSTGDASLAPATVNIYNTLIWKLLFASADNEGYIFNQAEELEVTGTLLSVQVGKGAALVNGTFYKSDEIESVVIDTPVTDPRIDRIVLRKDWALKTVRITKIEGTENASPTAPALVQTEEVQWDIPLAQALITTSGVITVTDEREKAVMRVAGLGSLQEIETFTAVGDETEIDFRNISQDYKSLFLCGHGLATGIAGSSDFSLNGDFDDANYNFQNLSLTAGATPAAFADIARRPGAFPSFTPATGIANVATYMEMEVRDYTKTDKYKTFFLRTHLMINNVTPDWGNFIKTAIVWKNTEAINRITVSLDVSLLVFTAGSKVTLYGRL